MPWLSRQQTGIRLDCTAPLAVAHAAAHQYAKAKEASDADREQEPCSAHNGQRLSFKVPMRWLVLAGLSLEQETLQMYNTPSLIHPITQLLDMCHTLGSDMYTPERLPV